MHWNWIVFCLRPVLQYGTWTWWLDGVYSSSILPITLGSSTSKNGLTIETSKRDYLSKFCMEYSTEYLKKLEKNLWGVKEIHWVFPGWLSWGLTISCQQQNWFKWYSCSWTTETTSNRRQSFCRRHESVTDFSIWWVPGSLWTKNLRWWVQDHVLTYTHAIHTCVCLFTKRLYFQVFVNENFLYVFMQNWWMFWRNRFNNLHWIL